MIDRYTTPELAKIWNEKSKFETWLEVEIAATNAWAKVGKVPAKDAKLIEQNAKFDIARINEIEKETRHDVIAFTRAVSESLGQERKWVHYGLTSTDVVDTAQALTLKKANKEISKELKQIHKTLVEMANKYKLTPMMGRTHGVHAEVTTFGMTLGLWAKEMERNISRFTSVCKEIEVGKISGAVGTHSNVSIEVEELICKSLKISRAPISTQTLQRDRHANYMSQIALIGSTLEKIAVQIRHMQRTEVREVEEGFAKGQKGSSAMPHKRNPIGSENISGLARVLRGNMVAAFENIALWHERDISHSSVERIILADSTTLIHYMLRRMNGILQNLTVNEKKMLENINITKGLVFSQKILSAIIDSGCARETAYDIIQPIAMKCWESGKSFEEEIKKSKDVAKYLSKTEIEKCFNIKNDLKEINNIFKAAKL